MRDKSLITKGLAICGIAVGLFLINSQPAQATMINRDYKPTLEYQYRDNVHEDVNETTFSAFTSQNIGTSGLTLETDGSNALEITGTAQTVGEHELDLTSTPVQAYDPMAMVDLYIHIKVRIYLPYTINYVDESGNILLTEDGRVYEDNKWIDTQNQFVATGSNAGQRYKVKDAQSYAATQFIAADSVGSTGKPRVNISTSYAQGTPSPTVTYNLVCEQVSIPSSGSGSSGSSSGRALIAKTGWIYRDAEDAWYYYSGYSRSSLKKGWHYDTSDKHWYYLALDDGKMFKGWHLINDKWYFFTPQTSEKTWELGSDGEWYYLYNTSIRPLGSMYVDELTPDGYRVNSDGQYEQ